MKAPKVGAPARPKGVRETACGVSPDLTALGERREPWRHTVYRDHFYSADRTPSDTMMTDAPSPPAGPWRVFAAIWPDEALLDEFAGVDRLFWKFDSHRIIPRASRHLTVAFLGDVEPSMTIQAELSLRESLTGWNPFLSRVDGLLALPSPRAPKIIAARVILDESLDVFLRTARRILAETCPTEAILRDLDRTPTPHITLARSRRTARARRLDLGSLPPVAGILKVESIGIIRSILTPSGAEYQTLRTISVA